MQKQSNVEKGYLKFIKVILIAENNLFKWLRYTFSVVLHHWLDGPGFGWPPGVGDGQGGLACCDSWGRKESDMTEQLNWTEALDGSWDREISGPLALLLFSC